MTNTEKRLEKHTKEVIIEQIDICLSGQDPRYQLGRYIEHLKEELIHQALAEERERVNNKIEEYFDGLIVVSLPQATKESLLESLKDK